MTKQELFKRAHRIARMTAQAAGSYRIAFSCALRGLYAGEYSLSFEKILARLRDVLEMVGAKWHLCSNLRDYVVYLNGAAAVLGYNSADQLANASLRIGEMPSKEWAKFVVWAWANRGVIEDIAHKYAISRRSYRSAVEDPEDLLSFGRSAEYFAKYA